MPRLADRKHMGGSSAPGVVGKPATGTDRGPLGEADARFNSRRRRRRDAAVRHPTMNRRQLPGPRPLTPDPCGAERSFRATLEGAEKSRVYLVLPFNPEKVWGPRVRYHVRGVINGRGVRGPLEPFSKGYFLA